MYRILYDKKTDYSRYRVIDRIYNDRPSRLLVGDQSAPQSGMALDDDPELLFDYNQRLLEVALSLTPRSVLVIGGGAFTLQKTIAERLSNVKVDTVEIDPVLPKLARKYFGLKRSRNLTVITQDGREYINNCQTKYDLIVIDAFSGYEVPTPLLTVEAASRYAQLLTPKGTIAINIIAKYQGAKPTLTHRLMATFDKLFTTIELYPADHTDNQRGEQNLIFVASLAPSISLDYLQSVRIYPQNLDRDDLELRD